MALLKNFILNIERYSSAEKISQQLGSNIQLSPPRYFAVMYYSLF